MPNYLYNCKACEVEFEELLIQSAEIKEYFTWHPCPICHQRAERVTANAVAFNFKGGTPGNSGSHDVDYPTLDKAVGRSAEKRWGIIHERQEARNKLRRQAGTNAITQTESGEAPASPGLMKAREQALGMFKSAKSKPNNK